MGCDPPYRQENIKNNHKLKERGQDGPNVSSPKTDEANIIIAGMFNLPKEVNGVKFQVDCTKPNPNGVELDNLYLDMNGIIHPCTHPEDKPAPKDEDEMMAAIFECIDRLFRIVRPRKLLYMAIDGVAPWAKMNQQRSRRFRASKETVEKIQEISRLRSELAAKGCHLPPEKPKESHFDSNCITPGTPFMARLSACLHYYVHDRLNHDPAWQGIKVILSDANVPGEGKLKIMDYIRRQRAQPDHDPNTQHCLCGADADLIMLGLATHEPNFTIIREEFKPNKPRPCDICGQVGHEMKECVGIAKEMTGENDEVPPTFSAEVEFIFVRLNIFREYLEKELEMPNLPFKYDFKQAVDDWVFMCFFVGNDFLPHLPSLEIREGPIDRLVNLYKKTVYMTGVCYDNADQFYEDTGYDDFCPGPSDKGESNYYDTTVKSVYDRRALVQSLYPRKTKKPTSTETSHDYAWSRGVPCPFEEGEDNFTVTSAGQECYCAGGTTDYAGNDDDIQAYLKPGPDFYGLSSQSSMETVTRATDYLQRRNRVGVSPGEMVDDSEAYRVSEVRILITRSETKTTAKVKVERPCKESKPKLIMQMFDEAVRFRLCRLVQDTQESYAESGQCGPMYGGGRSVYTKTSLSTIEMPRSMHPDYKSGALVEATDKLAQAKAACQYDEAIRAAEAVAAGIHDILKAEEANVDKVRGFKAELTDCVNEEMESLGGTRPIIVLG